MKRSVILTASLFMTLAPLAMATPAIMKENNKKSCKDCHAALPATKANLSDEGKKAIKK